ncbi:TIM barrel protein [Pseudomonas syringae]|uniref:TIM barrel protein n=2 Tax=Pseudomonas syringae group TaxID=136849 RepID=A0AAJ4B5I1_PSESX|nr:MULTISPECIES: TIM barrel protein [Pseudomonas]AKF46849.1 putative sugar epimerase [Pseudomonas syringae pv. syringae B301D]EXL31842.1 Inosose isomerase [Pseudomonas syringae pv. syringae str. B301D-R]KTB87776.1 xylose isomerase [Pseudomonas syringae ICMP 13102]MCA5968876.1 TIM barrel protein [Pseudomonas sp. P129]MCH5487039.1 TIM barrel protein [Pseudomonas syringae pv. syringae]
MNQPLRFALNRMVAPRLSLESFVDLAVKLGADAIEIRNDLKGVEIENGTAPGVVRDLCAARGVQVLSINALYPFDVWNEERAAQATKLAQYARDCGARGLVLCPLNDRADPRNGAQRASGLRTALTALAPILREHGILGLVEPLGFEECSLRLKRQAVDAIKAVGGLDVYRLVHDTFHHHLAGEVELFPELTGLVHISGVEDAQAPLNSIRDGHRVLVGEGDILGNASQIERLLDSGYQGHLSFEPFAESVHALDDIPQAIAASMTHLSRAVSQRH